MQRTAMTSTWLTRTSRAHVQPNYQSMQALSYTEVQAEDLSAQLASQKHPRGGESLMEFLQASYA